MATLQKQLGAYYTPERVARVLVDWAVRTPKDRVLDPACGDGVFLEAAAERFRRCGARHAPQIFGVEVNHVVYIRSILPLLRRFAIPKDNVVPSDFFDLTLIGPRAFEAVVGNPPFIRYQSFRGRTRDRALLLSRARGVELSELASSWAPFLVHACDFLAPGGRLAMVVPAEITHATYARPVVQFLCGHFAEVMLASFEHRLFPELSQDALLLFGDGFGGRCKQVRFGRFRDVEELQSLLTKRRTFGQRLSIGRLQDSNGRLRSHFLPKEVKALYDFLASAPSVCRIGEIAEVGIGYVTGNNKYFHLSQDEAMRLRIDRPFLKPTLLRSSMVAGLRVSLDDWRKLREHGEKVYLLSLPRDGKKRLPAAIRAYVAEGEAHQVHRAFKCAARSPWYSVLHKKPADAFLTYMCGESPRVVWNAAQLLATNSLHEVRFRSQASPWKTAFAFCGTLSQISSEIEGHPMGGGMLKLEPTEAERVLVARPERLCASWADFEEVDMLVRAGCITAAMDIVDNVVLRKGLGLTWEQIQVLRDGLQQVREARRKKIAPS